MSLGKADGDSQGVRSVLGDLSVGQGKMQRDHFGHLALVGPAVAGDRVLDLGRSVLVGFQALTSQRRQKRTPRLGQDDERARVHAEKGSLEYCDLGLPANEQSRELGDHVRQAIRDRARRRTGEPAMGDGAQRSTVGFDQAVSGVTTAGIQA